jgi:hypothetical protein
MLSKNALRKIMSEDIYYAVPQSISNYLSHKVTDPDCLFVAERLLAKALRSSGHNKKGIFTRATISELSRITLIKPRTLTKKLDSLEKSGVITNHGFNKKQGTLYQLNICGTVVGLIKPRTNAPTPSSPQPQLKQDKHPLPSPTPPVIQDESPTHTPQVNAAEPERHAELLGLAESIQNQIDELKQQLSQYQAELDETNQIYTQMLREMLKRKGLSPRHIDDELLKELENTNPEYKLMVERERSIQALFRQAKSFLEDLTVKQAQLESEIKAIEKDKTATPSHHRYLSKPQTLGLATRIAKLSGLSDPAETLLEVAWAFRFGWYSQVKREWDLHRCFTHALSLIRKNNWSRPFGYDREAIAGLVHKHLGHDLRSVILGRRI